MILPIYKIYIDPSKNCTYSTIHRAHTDKCLPNQKSAWTNVCPDKCLSGRIDQNMCFPWYLALAQCQSISILIFNKNNPSICIYCYAKPPPKSPIATCCNVIVKNIPKSFYPEKFMWWKLKCVWLVWSLETPAIWYQSNINQSILDLNN